MQKGEKKMQNLKGKTMAILIATILTISMTASLSTTQNTFGQVYPPKGTHIPTYAYLNVAPNPVGVGQTVNVNFFLATPMETVEYAVNMTVRMTQPDGTVKTLGPFTSDLTGGSFTNVVPDQVGTYSFQFFYGGQTLGTNSPWSGLINDPSESTVVTLTVQEEPVQPKTYPFTPLPTSYWQTPVTAQNVQNWYTLTGAWLGYGSVSFAQTGGYNVSSFYNPYTASVNSGHVLWTKPWAEGGVVGGDFGGNEQDSHYWSTSQYQPKYAPVVMNGILYSTWYTTTTSYSNGIRAVDLYTGQDLWVINTTNALRCGMNVNAKMINQYGVVGPYIWTTGSLPASDTGGVPIVSTGTQWNMYDGLTGKYVLSVVNGSALTLRTDENGNMIGYFINNTAGTEMTHPTFSQNVPVTNTGPHLTAINMTVAIGQSGQQWNPRVNTVRSMDSGEMWSVPVATSISGVPIGPTYSLALNSITGNELVLTGGFVHGQGVGGEQAGWLIVSTMDMNTGAQLFTKNITQTDTAALLPYTRTTVAYGNGLIVIANDVNYVVAAFDTSTGTKRWETTLTGLNGGEPNHYDLFSLKPYFGKEAIFWEGLGGDLWAINIGDGKLRWYTNTTQLIGDPGIETPYDIWPLWVFSSSCVSTDVAYFAVGHEYNPPLFHGAQLIAVNCTDGSLVWSELDTSVTSTEISYGILLSLNAYDNQIYAFGKGPSAMTVTAPTVGVTTNTPITITGTIMDVSAGSKQNAVAANFPHGLPCISDESQSKWMEYVYQQQVKPTHTTGVLVTISVIDSNHNERAIGTTTSDDAGSFGFTWTPDISGDYQITASFAGSESYWPSSATTYAHASEASTPAPTAELQQGLAKTSDLLTYMTAGVIAIIIAIAIVGFLILRKHP
jgi:outer membrane protein assembly factor BamB